MPMRPKQDLVDDSRDLLLSLQTSQDRAGLQVLLLHTRPALPLLQERLQVPAHPRQVKVQRDNHYNHQMASPINNNKGHMDRPNNTHNKAPMDNYHTHNNVDNYTQMDTYHNKAHMDNYTPLDS